MTQKPTHKLPNLSLQIGDVIEGMIEKIAFGGDGVLRCQQFVFFIPFTAIGDHVQAKITELKSNFGRAELQSLLKPSPLRVTPPCPYFGQCGGCQLQHMSPDAQNDYKQNSVKEAFGKQIKNVTFPIHYHPSADNLGYRRRISLQLKPVSKLGMAAVYTDIHHEKLKIAECQIFLSKNSSFIKRFQSFLSTFSYPLKSTQSRVTILKDNAGGFVVYFMFKGFQKMKPSFFTDLMKAIPEVHGVLVDSNHQKFHYGQTTIEMHFEKLAFQFTPESFIQNNSEQSEQLYQNIIRIIGKNQKKKILDLYCGFGITTLLLNQNGHDVSGIEINPEAIKLARINNEKNSLNAHFYQGDVSFFLDEFKKKEKHTDSILINPPRSGLSKEGIRSIAEIQPKEIIYTSCMPSTLARDCSLFLSEGYKINSCNIYDMFPQTAHVETVIHLSR